VPTAVGGACAVSAAVGMGVTAGVCTWSLVPVQPDAISRPARARASRRAGNVKSRLSVVYQLGGYLRVLKLIGATVSSLGSVGKKMLSLCVR